MKLSVVILAAGKGTRMRSALPKVLHVLADKPLLSHVVNTAQQLQPTDLHIVYGHGGEQVQAAFADTDLHWVEQTQQLGTGHAVQQALPQIPDDHQVLVLYGDVPLTRKETLSALLELADNGVALLTMRPENPKGYGRIVRDAEARVQAIVEEKDADERVRQMTEVNTGILTAPAKSLKSWLSQLSNDNAQGEYYLTDIVSMAVAEDLDVKALEVTDLHEALGVNNRAQLAGLERYYQQLQAEILMVAGAALRDPARIDIRGELEVDEDVMIDVNVVFEGRVKLGKRVKIGPNCVLKNVELGDDTEVLASCVLNDSIVGKGCHIGPFAHLRPDNVLADAVKVGNFVELKKSHVATASKINHLSYVGDAEVGEKVNVGAGTITCNYDGTNKHKTLIGDGVFVGSNTLFVAPVTIEAGATIGAGSVITTTAPADTLTLSRAQQRSIPGWQRPTKKTS